MSRMRTRAGRGVALSLGVGVAALTAWAVFAGPAGAQRSLAFLGYGGASPGTIATAKLGELVGKGVSGVASVRTTTGGSQGNIILLSRKRADLAATTLDLYKASLEGRTPFKEKVRGVASVSRTGGLSIFYFTAVRGAGVRSLGDLSAKKASLKLVTRQRGTSGELWARRVLAEFKLDYDAIRKAGGSVVNTSNPEAVNLVKDGHANAWFAIGGYPFGPLVDLALGRPLTFISLPASLREKMEREFGYVSQAVPAGTYKGQGAPYETVATLDIWVVREDLPAELVYSILKQLAANLADYKAVHRYAAGLTLESAPKGLPNLHPGAQRFYREKGLLR